MRPALAFRLEPAADAKSALCREILTALPDWFGIPSSIEAYAAEARQLPMILAEAEGRPLGFATLRRHSDYAGELHLIALKADEHRRGIGRALLGEIEALARRQGLAYLTVKTLAPTVVDAAYAGTRAFYDKMGFRPLEIFPTLWSPENPCLLMGKNL